MCIFYIKLKLQITTYYLLKHSAVATYLNFQVLPEVPRSYLTLPSADHKPIAEDRRTLLPEVL